MSTRKSSFQMVYRSNLTRIVDFMELPKNPHISQDATNFVENIYEIHQ
jgi:hypothetical protein